MTLLIPRNLEYSQLAIVFFHKLLSNVLKIIRMLPSVTYLWNDPGNLWMYRPVYTCLHWKSYVTLSIGWRTWAILYEFLLIIRASWSSVLKPTLLLYQHTSMISTDQCGVSIASHIFCACVITNWWTASNYWLILPNRCHYFDFLSTFQPVMLSFTFQVKFSCSRFCRCTFLQIINIQIYVC